MQSVESSKQNLPEVSEKQVNAFICEIEPKEHRDEDYKRLLNAWLNYSATTKHLDQKLCQNVEARPRRAPGLLATNLCEVCYDELPWRKKWCRMCGCHCCDKCITRVRKMPNFNEPVMFCEKCDRQYMEGLLAVQFMEGLRLRESAFSTLAHEQELVESLMQIERHKIISLEEETGEKNHLIECSSRIIQLRSQNRSLQSDIAETQRKLQWGNDIQKQLKKKQRRTRKLYQSSFASSVNEDSEAIAPPEVDDSEAISVENLNESILNSMFDDEQYRNDTPDAKKCNCRLM